ncbi:MAP7 domain-containing protein 2a isoform X5 [Acanthopagrus latus]|uniref:MAP7 domain-containing protein 2a isoform X5 n=1 Tax=Acanthopagrus latus TaxID=8177 RepID=UPI00187CE6F1|nr:MAP7 domain-containing protein 2a isoform X5 [Acanthopagrus latus]
MLSGWARCPLCLRFLSSSFWFFFSSSRLLLWRGTTCAASAPLRTVLGLGEKMAPPSITLLPEKKSPTNGHSSPARTGRTTPSSAEKKPHINGHASPSHLAAHISNNHAGKQIVDGYMKTDDRMRLAKERREERERSLAAREQLIREKERRARLQYERTVEERWRRLEEQRQREELRRAAVEEKRRQQLEEERERLEALMKRSLERSLQLEQRTKRWSRGCHPGAAPCSPHRSPFCTSLNPTDRAGLQGGSQSTPNTPKKERLRRERRTASPGCGSPVRRSESPASTTRHLASPTTSKLAGKMRAQSPSNTHQYHCSPTRHRSNLLNDDRRAEDKKVAKHGEQSKEETTVRKNDNNVTNLSLQVEKNVLNNEATKPRSSKVDAINKHLRGDSAERNLSPDRRDNMSPRVESSEKKTQNNAQDGDKKKESEPCTSAAKMAAGTTNAEEATRVLAERRRQARAQKELEDEKRKQEEEERVKEEQRRKQLAQQEQRQQEAKAQQAKEKAKTEEELHQLKQEEDQHKKEEQEKELQAQMEKEREKAKVQAQEDAERQRQDRELQAQQEEEERQLRKKRIEEIMKRTRKGEADMKKEEQVETRAVSPPGEEKTVQTNAQVNEQVIKKVEFQVKEQVTVQVNTKECAPVKKEAAAAAAVAQIDNQKSLPVKNTQQVTPSHSVPHKRPETKQSSDERCGQPNREAKDGAIKQPGREVDMNVNHQQRANVKAADQIKKEPTRTATDAKVNQKKAGGGGGGMMNGAVKGEGSALMSSHPAAEVSKQQSQRVTTAERKTKVGSQVEVIRPSVTTLPVGHLSPPIIKLEPLDVKGTGTCDEVQSMEVSPASKEELISIPEFSPVNEIQNSSLSNTRALEDLMDLTGSTTYPKLSSEDTAGDCNKNLIEGVVSPMSDSKIPHWVPVQPQYWSNKPAESVDDCTSAFPRTLLSL